MTGWILRISGSIKILFLVRTALILIEGMNPAHWDLIALSTAGKSN
jgi:hypothetical protein